MANMNLKDALNKSLQATKKYVDNAINTNSIVRPYEVFRVEETIFGKTGYIDVETMVPSVKYGLAEEYLDCSSFAFVIPTATTPYSVVCLAASFQVSDLMVTEKWEGDPSKGEEGLYIIVRGLNVDYKINIRHKESKSGITIETIRNTRYLDINNTKEFIPTGDYNPATKKYVDDAIAENGFSGDYNDLINKPCYDTREHVELLFDNDLTGRETITSDDGNTIYVKLKGDIVLEDIDGISQGTYTVRYFDGSGGWHDETYLVSEFISKINDLPIYKIDDIIVVLEDCFVNTWWQSATSFTNGIWIKYMKEEGYYSSYVTTLEYMDSSSGEIKQLDEKFVSYKPGIKPEEGQSVTIRNWHTEGSIEATVSERAEIFNDYKNNFATGECSHAEGRYTNAVGDCSHAEGNENTAEGFAAHAEGYTTSSSGEASHSEGRLTEASGDYSHAEGYWTEASGEISHAEGEWTKASSECQHVQGKYNIEDTENKYAHIVGNGNSRMRSNAHTLDWDGNAWYQGQVQGTNLPHDTRVFGEIEITFDGDIEGKETILVKDPLAPSSLSDVNAKSAVTSNMRYVKASDKAISYEEFCSVISLTAASISDEGEFTEFNFPIEELKDALIKINDNVFVFGYDFENGNHPFIIITHENITVDSVLEYTTNNLILTPGIWFLYYNENAYISKFKYQGVISGELKKLDEKYLPDSIANGINVITEEDLYFIFDTIDDDMMED